MTTFNELARAAEKTDSLARAIDYLGATDLGNGRYALFMGVDDPQHWLVTDANDLIRATFSDEDFKNTVRMPSWWTPERQFAYRFASSVYSRRDDAEADAQACAQSYAFKGEFAPSIQRVTVNLETGEEVPV